MQANGGAFEHNQEYLHDQNFETIRDHPKTSVEHLPNRIPEKYQISMELVPSEYEHSRPLVFDPSMKANFQSPGTHMSCLLNSLIDSGLTATKVFGPIWIGSS